eukprot:7350635-Prymnesium_polylepis.1
MVLLCDWHVPGYIPRAFIVGCLEARKLPGFRDGGRLELRPVGVVLETHGLIVAPSHLMAASQSPVPPVLGPPPTPDSLVNKAALAGL